MPPAPTVLDRLYELAWTAGEVLLRRRVLAILVLAAGAMAA
jgi:hypothetical protein